MRLHSSEQHVALDANNYWSSADLHAVAGLPHAVTSLPQRSHA